MSVLILPNENVTINDVCDGDWTYEKYIAILRKCFPKNYVSIGTLIRKLPAFLMLLYNSSKDYEWSAYVIRYPREGIFMCDVFVKHKKDDTDNQVFQFSINCRENTKRHALRLINDYFIRDKFYHGKHDRLKVQFHSSRGYAIYDKFRFTGTKFKLSVSTAPLSFSNCLMRICGSESKILAVQ